MLRLAAREADIVGINPALRSGKVDSEAARDGVAASTDRKVEWVREEAGDRYADLELNMLVLATVITEDRDGTLAAFGPAFDLSPEELAAFPHAFIGTVEQVVEDVIARRERWDVSYFVVQGADAMEAIAPVVARLAGT
jgi:hypothetical protein